MRERCHIIAFLCCILLPVAFSPLQAQMGFDVDVKKPEPYENRVLKAEKTPTDKQIKAPKRFLQNTVTHFNYFFNANNKLNEIITNAKTAHQEDYSKLLPFYNYSLDVTAADSLQLDSVIYKSKTGIIMHDLRNDWIDNLYMLWGASYFFRKQYDSASLMFQFINYAFAEKEKDGYYKYIGSRMDGNNALSVSTKESKSFVKKVFSVSPSRNDAFIWQIRSQIELGNLTEAGSLIATLKNDPNFPARLHDQLEEVEAYWYYRQGVWDSSATHLVNALSQATTKQEKGRWEYLAAQMYERSGKPDKAQEYYTKSMSHGTDPVMDVYARLNLVKTNKEGGENYIDQNVAELVKMARREKFAEYRDVIYYMAAQIELERGNLAAAQAFLMKASQSNNGNLSSRNNAFLMIADLSFDQKKYVQAASFYDSVQNNDLKEADAKRIAYRKPPLAKVVLNTSVISRQDSMQRIAAMPEEERKTYLTRLARKMRKEQGLAEENTTVTSGSKGPLTAPPADLFTNASKGDWYFYNSSLKTQGAATFRQAWGNRPNADNWRRFSAVSNQLMAKGNDRAGDVSKAGGQPGGNGADEDNTPSYSSLLKKLPLTPEAIKSSNDSIKHALFNLGAIYASEIEDHASAIESLEEVRRRFPDFEKMDETLFHLYYAYTKSGNAAKAAEIRSLMSSRYPSSRFTAIATTGKDPQKVDSKSPQATRDYEAVYDMFIEGRFEEAKAAKRRADSVYQTNYWQPQLLYIEAVYHVKQREDSVAKNILQTLVAQDPNAPLSKKAQNLIDVLARRRQIEDELAALQIERPVEERQTIKELPVQQPVVKDTFKVAVKPVERPITQDTVAYQPAQRETVTLNTKTGPQPVTRNSIGKPTDTLSGRKIVVPQKQSTSYRYDPSFPHYAVIILNKVDAVFSSEAKNAFNRFGKEKFYSTNLPVSSIDLDADNKLILVEGFVSAQTALDYVTLAKKLAPTEIVPWLKSDKYAFAIISAENLQLLQTKKDLVEYRKFLEQNLPGKF